MSLTPINESRSELDSHADTCVVGNKTALVIHDFDRPVRVQGYSPNVGAKEDCHVVSAVVAYDHPTSGQTYMLIINQAILIPEIDHNLLCPMQLRDNGIKVNDEPKHMLQDADEYHHAIAIPASDWDSPDNIPFIIPLLLNGVTSFFPSRKPSAQE